MKLLLISIAFLLSFTIQAQHTKPKHKILLGFNFSPDYSFRTLKNSDGSSSSDIIIKSRNDIEIAKLGYTTGVDIVFNYSKVAFETGIQYANKGYKTKNQDLISNFPIPPLNAPPHYKINYAYQYVGIPIKARFSFGKSKLHFITSVGVTTNFLLNVKQTIVYQYSDGKTETHTQSTTSGFNKIDISPLISVGVDYKISNKIHLTAEPTFRYGLIKTVDAPIKEKLWSGGLNIGFYYGIK